jgi:hypothetical protein
MRVAVVSDIHGNYHALETVLAAVDAEAPDELWCLGDLVGYGPRPNECVARVAPRAAVCLAGNHDLAVLGTIDVDEFSSDAAVAARWSAEVLDADARVYLEGLAPQAKRPGAELYHASPRDPVWDYVLTMDAAAESWGAGRRPRPRRHRGRPRRALAPQPGLGRPASRRRPARGLAAD